MKLIRPVVMTDNLLVACDVPENDYPQWSVGTTYSQGDRVVVVADHRVYESLQSNNIGTPPATTPEWWLALGATNRWKMFDDSVGSQTTQAESLEVTIAPGVIDSIALMDLDAVTISFTMTDPVEGIVFTEQIDMAMKTYINDAWAYFFEPIILDDTVVLLGVAPYGSATLTITINSPGGTAKIGTLVVGAQKDLGLTRQKPVVGITDYSKKQVDIFGSYSVAQRAYSKRMSVSTLFDNARVDELHRTLAAFRAMPVVWVAAEGLFSSMVIFGFYKNFEILIEGETYSVCSLEVEGLS